MRSRDTKRRSVYPYTCKHCTHKRIAFSYARAKARTCAKCERLQPAEGQVSLFTVRPRVAAAAA